jgi:HD-like signal output (HDOD) protein
MTSSTVSPDSPARGPTLDPSLSARILRIANSAFYSLPATVGTVSRAVNILGSNLVCDLALAASVCHSFQDMPPELMDMDRFWRSSVHTGYVSRSLMQEIGGKDGEVMFVRGLLHDIGHLLLYNQFPNECRTALERAHTGEGVLDLLERETIGCDAAQVGAFVLRNWRLPNPFVETLQFQNRPQDAPEHAREAAVLHIAARMVESAVTEKGLVPALGEIDPVAWELTGLTPETAERVTNEVSADMIETMYTLLMPG